MFKIASGYSRRNYCRGLLLDRPNGRDMQRLWVQGDAASFPGYGAQRQYATSLTSYSYVLSIDADEVLSPALRSSLIKLKEEGFAHRVYEMSRLNFYCGQP